MVSARAPGQWRLTQSTPIPFLQTCRQNLGYSLSLVSIFSESLQKLEDNSLKSGVIVIHVSTLLLAAQSARPSRPRRGRRTPIQLVPAVRVDAPGRCAVPCRLPERPGLRPDPGPGHVTSPSADSARPAPAGEPVRDAPPAGDVTAGRSTPGGAAAASHAVTGGGGKPIGLVTVVESLIMISRHQLTKTRYHHHRLPLCWQSTVASEPRAIYQSVLQ